MLVINRIGKYSCEPPVIFATISQPLEILSSLVWNFGILKPWIIISEIRSHDMAVVARHAAVAMDKQCFDRPVMVAINAVTLLLESKYKCKADWTSRNKG